MKTELNKICKELGIKLSWPNENSFCDYTAIAAFQVKNGYLDLLLGIDELRKTIHIEVYIPVSFKAASFPIINQLFSKLNQSSYHIFCLTTEGFVICRTTLFYQAIDQIDYGILKRNIRSSVNALNSRLPFLYSCIKDDYMKLEVSDLLILNKPMLN